MSNDSKFANLDCICASIEKFIINCANKENVSDYDKDFLLMLANTVNALFFYELQSRVNDKWKIKEE